MIRAVAALLAIGALLSPWPAAAKGEGVGLWMDGTVSQVREVRGELRFVVKGRFSFTQFRGTQGALVEVDGTEGISVRARQANPFFAMTTDWGGGSIREDPRALGALLKSAERSSRAVKFELADATLRFGPERKFAVEGARVVRATDHDLH